MRTLGLPCAHMIQPLLQQDQPLLLHHFHTHWLLHRPGTPRLIIEPHKQFDRLAASSKLPPTSTQREPCASERVEKALQPKAPPKCSKCGIRGHKMNSKACLLRYDDLLPAPTQTSTTTHITTHSTTRSVTRSLSPSGSSVVSETIACTTTHTTTHTTTQVLSPPVTRSATVAAGGAREKSPLRGDHALVIFQRYKEAREAWYATLTRRAQKTDQLYRKAMKLPQKYAKREYEWCLDYKQMGPRCQEESRDWRQEEMMSYIDWDKAETKRVEERIQKEIDEQPFSRHRGVKHVWEATERDVRLQGGGL